MAAIFFAVSLAPLLAAYIAMPIVIIQPIIYSINASIVYSPNSLIIASIFLFNS